MGIIYNKQLNLLIAEELKKIAGISSSSLPSLGKNENISTRIFLDICKMPNFKTNDILPAILDTYSLPHYEYFTYHELPQIRYKRRDAIGKIVPHNVGIWTSSHHNRSTERRDDIL